MEKNTALILLGFDSKFEIGEESLEIALEEAIFTEASFFMRRNFIPKLAEARILKLSKLTEAASSFGIQFPEKGECYDPDLKIAEIEGCQKIIELVKIYQEYEMDIKLAIANEENPSILIELLKNWISLFSAYAKRFTALFENLNTDLSNSEIQSVSITQAIDYNELMTELRKEIYTNSVFREYLRIVKMNPKSS